MTSERADIRSIDLIDRFRVTLAGFVAAVRSALIEAEAELDRTLLWLDKDRIPHWIRQIRLRQELVTRARGELYRKRHQAAAEGGRAGDTDERRRVRRAEERLQAAEDRLAATRRWVRQLEREKSQFKGAASGLATAVEHDLPHAMGLLQRMSQDLEAYISMPMPDLHRLFDDAGDRAASNRRTGTPRDDTTTRIEEPEGGDSLDSDDSTGPGSQGDDSTSKDRGPAWE